MRSPQALAAIRRTTPCWAAVKHALVSPFRTATIASHADNWQDMNLGRGEVDNIAVCTSLHPRNRRESQLQKDTHVCPLTHLSLHARIHLAKAGLRGTGRGFGRGEGAGAHPIP